MASVFFVGGAAFNHYVLFPIAWVFLAGFSTDYMMFMPRIAPVFSLYAMLMLAMGLIFEMPAVDPRARPHGTGHGRVPVAQHQVRHPASSSSPSAVITPTGDMVTQSLMAGPMVVLYLVSIGLAWAFGKRRRHAED